MPAGNGIPTDRSPHFSARCRAQQARKPFTALKLLHNLTSLMRGYLWCMNCFGFHPENFGIEKLGDKG